MKKIVFIALIISFSFSLYIAYEQLKNNEIEKLATFEKEFASPFVIPKHEKLSDPEKVYPLLLNTAKEVGVNLFRTARYFRTDEQIEIIKYVLLTNETSFSDHIKVESGRMLHREETYNSRLFLSTIQKDDKNLVGTIHYFDPNQNITIQPLESSFNYLPVYGRFFAEFKNDKQFQLFLETLSQEINIFLNEQNEFDKPSYSPSDLQPPEAFIEPREGFFYITSSSGQFEQYILFSVTLLLIIYYIFNSAQQVGIYKMNGISNLHLWWIIAGRLITISFVTILLLTVFFVVGLQLPITFFYHSFLQIGQAYLILTIFSMIGYLYISRIKLSQTIKNRKDTQSIFILNMVLKVFCGAVLIILILETYSLFDDLRTQQERIYNQEKQINNWVNMDIYGLVTAHAGHTTAYTPQEFEEDLSRSDQALYEAYPAFNALGALYIDAGDYEQSALLLNQDFGGIISITVNPNYLEEFPVYDHNGKPVKVSEQTNDWVILVPEQYKELEEEIRQYFEGDEDIRNFFLRKDEGQEMKFIWLAQGQYIFSLNPDVFPAEKNNILDPIIHVKTEQNHLFTYRSGIKGLGLNDPLKVKLIDQDPNLTYDILEQEFKQLKLDNIINIVSFQHYVSEELHYLTREINSSIFTILGIISIFVFLIIQNLLIIFHKSQKQLVVRRLFGIGFFKTYQSIFIWLTLTSILFVALGYMMDQTQRHPQNHQLITSFMDIKFLGIVLSLLGIEILATIIALNIIERRNKIKVIKGG